MLINCRSDFEAIIELERALANRAIRGHRVGVEEGRAVGYTAGNHAARLQCSVAQNAEVQNLRDRVVNYRSLTRGQERQISQLQKLLGQAEDALRIRLQQEVDAAIPLHFAASLPQPVPIRATAENDSARGSTVGTRDLPN